MTTNAEKARELLQLHTDPELLILVNVWDVVTATMVAATAGVRAVATAVRPQRPDRRVPAGRRPGSGGRPGARTWR
jgi:hypothetical protein